MLEYYKLYRINLCFYYEVDGATGNSKRENCVIINLCFHYEVDGATSNSKRKNCVIITQLTIKENNPSQLGKYHGE